MVLPMSIIQNDLTDALQHKCSNTFPLNYTALNTSYEQILHVSLNTNGFLWEIQQIN